jgi:acyl carrier protein
MTDAMAAIAENVHARVWTVLREQFGPAADELTDDGEFVNVLTAGFDSLTALDTISRIESEFSVEVDFVGHDVRHWFASPARIVRFVCDQLEDQAALGSTS